MTLFLSLDRVEWAFYHSSQSPAWQAAWHGVKTLSLVAPR